MGKQMSGRTTPWHWLGALALIALIASPPRTFAATAPPGFVPGGLALTWYQGQWSRLPDLSQATPTGSGVASVIGLDAIPATVDFAVRYAGTLSVPTAGVYQFATTSDDGSALYIDDQRIVDNDGLHALQTRTGRITLTAGPHALRVEFFQRSGGRSLSVAYQTPAGVTGPLPAADLAYDPTGLPAPREPEQPAGALYAGLAYEYHEGDWSALPPFDTLTPRFRGAAAGFDLADRLRNDLYAFRFQGYVQVPRDGLYTFYTASDDGSDIYIGDQRVVNNDGLHPVQERAGTIALRAGLHRITLGYFEKWGQDSVAVYWSGPSFGKSPIPPEALFYTLNLIPPLRPVEVPPGPLAAGLAARYYEGDWTGLPDFGTLEPRAAGTSNGLDLSRAARADRFGYSFQGYVQVPTDGVYRFTLEADNASRLVIGGTTLVENTGAWNSKKGLGIMALAAGTHAIRVDYKHQWGTPALALSYRTPGGQVAPVPLTDLRHTADQLPPLKAALTPPAVLRPGLAYRYFEGAWSALPDFTTLAPGGLGMVPDIGLERAVAKDNYGFSFTGYLQVPADGFYDFWTNSDDGSRLWIDDALVVDNDGLHAARDAFGNRGLAAGPHRIRVDFFERTGLDRLAVTWRTPGGTREPLPTAALTYDPATLPTLKPADAAPAALLGGVEYAYYEWTKDQAAWTVLPNLAALTPTATGTQDGFSLTPRRRATRYAMRFTGYIDIPEYGYYNFYLSSDDGSRLTIGDQLVVDNDGLHAARERSGRIALERGRHAITVTFFQWDGDNSLSVAYTGPRFGKTPVGPEVLFRLDPARHGDPGTPPPPTGPTDPRANQAPLAMTDQAVTGIGAGQGLTLNVLANDSDPDGDLLQLIGADSAGAAGAAKVDWQRGRLVYYPALGFVGVDRVGYTLSDRRGGISQGEVRVQVGLAGPAPQLDAAAAVRFLTQASFGPTKADIALVMQQGPAAWIDAQLALPPSLHADVLGAVRGTGGNPTNRELRVRAWLERAVRAPDQLRQRIAFALSQILVISDVAPVLATQDGALGALDYYDLLVRGAFGNYRQLLGEITLHPAMGHYLNMAGNRKADPIAGTVPDENFAREILQLFSVGLWQLTPDGRQVLDDKGAPRPTYTQAEVMAFAQVFTGWDFAVASGPDRYRRPLVLNPAAHDVSAKPLLSGLTVPADQGGEADLTQALDNIAAHPNLPPFIARQLIQRLVTSNPSHEYVGRVAAVFSASGLDLGQLAKAILLDPEARRGGPDPLAPLAAAEPSFIPPGPAYGKVREPLLQLTALWRALGVDPAAIRLRLDQLTPLGQVPLSAPSVFNFFKPDYQSPGEIADLGLYAPELALVDEKQAIGAAGLIDDWTLGGAAYYDLGMELAFATAGGAKAVDHLARLFLAGAPSEGLHQILREELLDQAATTPGMGDAERLTRMLGAAYLILTSPEFQTQR